MRAKRFNILGSVDNCFMQFDSQFILVPAIILVVLVVLVVTSIRFVRVSLTASRASPVAVARARAVSISSIISSPGPTVSIIATIAVTIAVIPGSIAAAAATTVRLSSHLHRKRVLHRLRSPVARVVPSSTPLTTAP